MSEQTPPPKAIKEESNSTGNIESAPAAVLDFSMVAGRWVGEVREEGVDEPYRITLDFAPNGAGEVHYLGAGYDCRGVLAPLSAGKELVFIETITLQRDQCSDGQVYVVVTGDRMDWRWGFSPKEIYATSTLTRAN